MHARLVNDLIFDRYRRKPVKRDVFDIRFVAEQRGRPEMLLKDALTEYFEHETDVDAATARRVLLKP